MEIFCKQLEEKKMGVLPVSHSNTVSFENATGLVVYMEFRLQTPRALITLEHFAQLGYLANRETRMNKEDLAKRGQYVSLHDHDYADLVALARNRINQGLIPDNWIEEFRTFTESAE